MLHKTTEPGKQEKVTQKSRKMARIKQASEEVGELAK